MEINEELIRRIIQSRGGTEEDATRYIKQLRAGKNNSISESPRHDLNFNKFNSGDTHEMSVLGGIPFGKDNKGTPNLVEKDEVSYKLPQGEFIFSNRINTNGKVDLSKPAINMMAYGGYKNAFSGGGKVFKKKEQERLENKRKANYQKNRSQGTLGFKM